MIISRSYRGDGSFTGYNDIPGDRRVGQSYGRRGKREPLRGSRILDAQMKRDARIQRTARSKTVKRAVRTTFVMLFCFLIIALLLFFFAKVVLVVREVNFVGLSAYEETEILESGILPVRGFVYGIDKARIKSALTLHFPYIKSVYINRKLPSILELSVEEESPVYYIRACGEYFLVTNDLRVVDCVPDKAALDESGYREIRLPAVTRAISGRPLAFEGEIATGYIKNIIQLVEQSPIFDRVTTLVADDKFDIVLICDDIYRICLGDTSEAAVKMMVAAKILEDELFTPDVGAMIDVRNPKQARVIMGNH